jgi:hypothetical protein
LFDRGFYHFPISWRVETPSGVKEGKSNELKITVTDTVTITWNAVEGAKGLAFAVNVYTWNPDLGPVVGHGDAYFEHVGEPIYPKTRINVYAGEGGTVSPSGTIELGYKNTVTLKATPAEGYEFSHWEGDAIPGNYSTSNPITLGPGSHYWSVWGCELLSRTLNARAVFYKKPAPTIGKVRVVAYYDSEQVGASCLLGLFTYKTPFERELELGTYVVGCSYAGQTQTKTFTVEAGKTTTVEFRFQKLTPPPSPTVTPKPIATPTPTGPPPEKVTLKVKPAEEGRGTVYVWVDGVYRGANSNPLQWWSLEVPYGATITLQCKPEPGYEFTAWVLNGRVFSKDNPVAFRIYSYTEAIAGLVKPTPTPTMPPGLPSPVIPTPTKTPTPWAPTPWAPTPPTIVPPPTPIAVPAPTPTPTPTIYSLLPLVILGLGAGAMIYIVRGLF